MQSWYEPLISKVEQTYSDLAIVADGDGLGQDSAIRRALEEHFVLHDYRGELPLRAFLDGRDERRAVIFKPAEGVYIPFDVENSACAVTWRLKEIFPGLDSAVLKDISSQHYQDVYESYNMVKGSLGEAGASETLHLICQWLFGVNLATVNNQTRAAVLLAVVYRWQEYLPAALGLHLKDKNLALPEEVWRGGEAFYRWLSGEWKRYLASAEGRHGPAAIDFAEPALREIVAGLFLDGRLQPCPQPQYESFPQLLADNPWLRVGLVLERTPSAEEECRRLLGKIWNMLDADSGDWPGLAALWGRCSYLKDRDEVEMPDYNRADAGINGRFEIYMRNHYEELFYRSYQEQPVTMDQVMHFLGSRSGRRKALLCFDGMGFQEWFCLREHLSGKGLSNFKESAVFALLPTVTVVSRRALFCGHKETAGLLPEEEGFTRHIEGHWRDGKNAQKGVFLNAPLEWRPEYGEYDYLGLVFNAADDIAHSRNLNKGGKRLLQMILETQLMESGVAELMGNLLKLGFRVYLTADHGLVHCRGSGYRADKYLADSRARRALIYPNRLLAEDFAGGKEVLIFRQEAIWGDKVLVVPRGREMFDLQGNTAVTHGGIHIEEVIVPFVEVLS